MPFFSFFSPSLLSSLLLAAAATAFSIWAVTTAAAMLDAAAGSVARPAAKALAAMAAVAAEPFCGCFSFFSQGGSSGDGGKGVVNSMLVRRT